MRKITIPVEIEIGRPSEIGLAMTYQGVEGRDEVTGFSYSANPTVGGLGLRFAATSRDVSYWAKANLTNLAEQVLEELGSEVQAELNIATLTPEEDA